MDLSHSTPLERSLRGPDYVEDRFEGGCFFGVTDPGNTHSGACRRDPAPGSSIGLCAEHADLLRQWSNGINAPDPRPPHWRNGPENLGMFPDLYIGGMLIGGD